MSVGGRDPALLGTGGATSSKPGEGDAPVPDLSAPSCVPRASEEIAQVRSKAQAEALAFQASLRKEQMRIHSLEKTVEQKVGTQDPRCLGGGEEPPRQGPAL